jgi:hypothetical protein
MSRIVDSKGEAFYCDRSHPDGDFCMVQGDIRIDSKSSTIVMYAVSFLYLLLKEIASCWNPNLHEGFVCMMYAVSALLPSCICCQSETLPLETSIVTNALFVCGALADFVVKAPGLACWEDLLIF